MDAARPHAGFGLFRVIVWATPILGFFGTVIGITMTLGGVAQWDGAGPRCASLPRLGPEVRHHGLGFHAIDGADVHPLLRGKERNVAVGAGDLKTEDELSGRFPSCRPTLMVIFRRLPRGRAMIQATEASSSARPNFGSRRS